MKYIAKWSAIHIGPFDSSDEVVEYFKSKELDHYEIIPLWEPNQ